MSKSDQFWQYAREAMLSAGYAKSDEVKQGLLELARTWTQAALQERASMDDHDTAAEALPRKEGWMTASTGRSSAQFRWQRGV